MKKMQRDIVGAFIFSSDNKMLFGKSVQGVYEGTWLIPGGGIEEGETKLEALKREVLEETGIDISGETIERLDLILTGESEKTFLDTGERYLVEMTFNNFKVTLKGASEDVTPVNNDDFTDARWFDLNELKDHKFAPPTIAALKELGLLEA